MARAEVRAGAVGNVYRKGGGRVVVPGGAGGLHFLVWGENWSELVNLRGESQPGSQSNHEITQAPRKVP